MSAVLRIHYGLIYGVTSTRRRLRDKLFAVAVTLTPIETTRTIKYPPLRITEKRSFKKFYFERRSAATCHHFFRAINHRLSGVQTPHKDVRTTMIVEKRVGAFIGLTELNNLIALQFEMSHKYFFDINYRRRRSNEKTTVCSA